MLVLRERRTTYITFLQRQLVSLTLDWSARYSHIAAVQFTSINCHMRYNMEATASLGDFGGIVWQLKEVLLEEMSQCDENRKTKK